MKTWALELARDGITANAIGPGSIEPPLWHAANQSQDPRTQKLLDSIPVGRLGTPADIENAVSFFLDDRSGCGTGHVLYVRAEERRVGKEWVSTGGYRWEPVH